MTIARAANVRRVHPALGLCNYYIKSKQAYCKFSTAPESLYCTLHDTDRIACPIDGSHTVAASSIWKHVKLCPRLRDAASDCLQPFYSQDYALYEGKGGERLEEQLGVIRSANLDGGNKELNAEEIAAVVEQIMPARLKRSDPNQDEGRSAKGAQEEAIIWAADECWSATGSEADAVIKEFAILLAPLLKVVEDTGLSATDGAVELDQIYEDSPTELREIVASLMTPFRLAAEEITVATLMENRSGRFKHLLQGLEMCSRLRRFMGSREFKRALEGGDWIELGAGRGGLMRMIMTITDAQEPGSCEGARYALIERERRRLVAEKRDNQGLVTTKYDQQRLRLYIDIADFDLTRFVQRRCDSIYDVIPWPAQLLAALYGGKDAAYAITSPNHVGRVLRRAAAVGSSRLAEVQKAVTLIAADAIETRPILLIAKHLCGVGTDLAIKSALRMVRELSEEGRQRDCYLMIAPCCYHCCAESEAAEVAALLATAKDERIRSLSKHVLNAVGWSTGASGLRAAIGRMLKDSILAGRVRRLQLAGAARVQTARYCPADVTLENTLLLAHFQIPSSLRF